MGKKSTHPSNGGFAQILGIFFLVGALFAVVAAINNKNITFNPNKRADSIYPTTPPTPNPSTGIADGYPCGEYCYSACESGTGINNICRSCEYYNTHKSRSQVYVECPPPWENGYSCGDDCCGEWCHSKCESGHAIKGVCVSCQYYNAHKPKSDPAVECTPPYENGEKCYGDCFENCRSGLGINGICRSCEYYNSRSKVPVECP